MNERYREVMKVQAGFERKWGEEEKRNIDVLGSDRSNEARKERLGPTIIGQRIGNMIRRSLAAWYERAYRRQESDTTIEREFYETPSLDDHCTFCNSFVRYRIVVKS